MNDVLLGFSSIEEISTSNENFFAARLFSKRATRLLQVVNIIVGGIFQLSRKSLKSF